MKELITHSRMDCFKSCRRKHWFAYELMLRPETDARALRMGTAFHAGIECLGKNLGTDAACEAINELYAEIPSEKWDALEWSYECETVIRLVLAYDWRWKNSGITSVAVEGSFRLPLLNPATGHATPNFDLAGKIDGIVRLEDGRLAVKESKLLGDDISEESNLWRRLRMDQQISLYIHAARQAGYAVDTVLYDVARKPMISPNPVPLTDSNGIKIVLDSSGERVRNANKTWRQTSDTEKKYVLQTRAMTVEEWGEKLTNDIISRPDFYFARHEIARLDADVNALAVEAWDIQLEIRSAQKTGRHYRTVNRNSCPFCPYFSLCSESRPVNPNEPAPLGFAFLDNAHPELEGDSFYVHESCAAPSTTPSAAASEIATGV